MLAMYKVQVSNRAKRQLRKLDGEYRSALITKLETLAQDPRPKGCTKVRDCYRIRQGDYRIIYEITKQDPTVIILAGGHRKHVYNNW